jgi:hypothetical protein
LRGERATLDDVVEILRGIAILLMAIDAKLEGMDGRHEDDEDEAAGS